MKAYERLQAAGPWLLGLTFFVLAGLAIHLSTVQLRSVTFIYGSEQVMLGGQASFRGVVYDPLLNRTRENVRGSWSLSDREREVLSGTINGYGEFVVKTEIPTDVTNLKLTVSIEDNVLDATEVEVALTTTTEPERPAARTLPRQHQAWALRADGRAILIKMHPLNAFNIVRGLEAPLIVQILDEDGNPLSGVKLELSDCEQTTDQEGYVFCENIFTRSASLPIRAVFQESLYRGEMETSGHSQSLRPDFGEAPPLADSRDPPLSRHHPHRPLAGSLPCRRVRYSETVLNL